MGLGSSGPENRMGQTMSQLSPLPLKCHFLSLKSVVGQLCKPHNMKDERLVSKIEGKTNFARDVKQFDGLTRPGLKVGPGR